MSIKVYPVTPIATICVLIFSGIMMLYPCQVAFTEGVRILHLMFFFHWLVVFLLALFCYALRIEVDEEEAEMRYVLLGITIRIPMDQIRDFEEASSGGYVRVNTTIVPFFFRPSMGARKFLSEHCGTAAGAKGIGYGTGKPAESSQKVVSAMVPAPAAMLSAAQSGGPDIDDASFITITRVESEKGSRSRSRTEPTSPGPALDMTSSVGEPTGTFQSLSAEDAAGTPKTKSLTPGAQNRALSPAVDRSRSPGALNSVTNRSRSPARSLSPNSAANRTSSPGKGAGRVGGYKRGSTRATVTGAGGKHLAFRRQHSAEALQEWNEELIRAVVEELFKDHDKDLNGHISWKGDEAKTFLHDFFEVFDHPLPKGLSSAMSAQYAEVITDSGGDPDTAEGLDIPQMCDFAHRVYKFTLKSLTGEMRAQRTKSMATGTFTEAAREARRSRVLSSINPELLAQGAANALVVEVEDD